MKRKRAILIFPREPKTKNPSQKGIHYANESTGKHAIKNNAIGVSITVVLTQRIPPSRPGEQPEYAPKVLVEEKIKNDNIDCPASSNLIWLIQLRATPSITSPRQITHPYRIRNS
ncbi:hypothetical protein GQX74_015567 [Glossina fuscipes]|nr:hypothetical protein GQX74_015567 [Glossina fuscipes]